MDKQRRVLVIDDDPFLRELIRAAFELEGIEILEAGHAIEAERFLLEEVPAAIVLDIGLPGIDGLFYCERLRASPRTRSVPIIVVSGTEEPRQGCAAAGATAYLRKPFDPLELLALIETSIGETPLAHAFAAGVSPELAADHVAELRRLIEIGHRQHELLNEAYRQRSEERRVGKECR